MKLLPYGISDFVRIRTEGYYYIDKTKFIEILEKYPPYILLLRPKRFGKSLFMNMISCYYDKFYANQFDELFAGTYIHGHKTKEQGKYHILKFDFSAVSSLGDVEGNFNYHCNVRIATFIKQYQLDLQIDLQAPTTNNLQILFSYCKTNHIDIYVMIDEYDFFINTILADSSEEYQRYVSGKSATIYKEFFRQLKAGTTDNQSPLKKMFITGVSPLVMFDVSSGANIGTNITYNIDFAEVLGVTRAELKEMLKHYNVTIPNEQSFDDWYNNYRFHKDQAEPMYNTDMILYYLKAFYHTGKEPENPVDANLRTDHSKLQYIVMTDRRLNGNYSVLTELFSKDNVQSLKLNDAFGVMQLKDRDNYISLLYHLGYITIEGYRRGKYLFKIPNQTMRILVAEYLRDVHEESELMKIDLLKFENLVADLAYDESLEVFYYLAERLKESSVIRDYIDGEGFIKGFLAAYLSLTPFYTVITERERNKGYADITCIRALNIRDEIIEPVIELKYIAQNKYSEAVLKDKIDEARQQIRRYNPQGMQRGLVIVYSAWEMVYCDWA